VTFSETDDGKTGGGRRRRGPFDTPNDRIQAIASALRIALCEGEITRRWPDWGRWGGNSSGQPLKPCRLLSWARKDQIGPIRLIARNRRARMNVPAFIADGPMLVDENLRRLDSSATVCRSFSFEVLARRKKPGAPDAEISVTTQRQKGVRR